MSMQDDTLILFSGLPEKEIENFHESVKNASERFLSDPIAEYFYPKCPIDYEPDDSEIISKRIEWFNENTSCHWTKWGYKIIEPPTNMGRIKFNFAITAECCGLPKKELEYYVSQLKERYEELELEVIVVSWFEDRMSYPAEIFSISVFQEKED